MSPAAESPWFWLALVLAALNTILLLALLLRRPARAPDVPTRQDLQQLLGQHGERLERHLRHEVQHSAREGRQEQAQSLAHFQGGLGQQLQAISYSLLQQAQESTRTQNAQIDAFAQQLAHLRGGLSETLTQQLQHLTEANARRMAEVRATLEQQLSALQAANSARLDEMRQTVDEKLQTTLEQRLGESFRHVAERLEQVHKGLGEMHTLAQGVGDLKHLLGNVKTRGIFGEAQLGALLEQTLSPEQYASQQATRPGSRHAVDFAVRLPGRSEADGPVWLPIDAKFPTEDYERLLDAQARADAAAAAEAGKALEARLRQEARSLADKYLEPPHTTEFGILFLPTESLYAEALRRPGLMQALQREYRITLAGPTTLLALLGSLQMGFKTLALEKRSSEVWQVLGAVKTEFGKFGAVLDRLKNQTQTVLNTLDAAQTRTRAMDRTLKAVEALPDDQSRQLLPELER